MLNYRKINNSIRKALKANRYIPLKLYKKDEYLIVQIETTAYDFEKMPKGVTEDEWVKYLGDYLKDANGIVERCFIDMGIPEYFRPLIFIDWDSKAMRQCSKIFKM